MNDSFVFTRWWAGLGALLIISVVLVIADLVIRSVQGRAPSKSKTRARQRGVKALVIGADGRASTSKLQVVLWTVAVLYAFTFLLLWGRSIGCDGADRTAPACVAAQEARIVFARETEEPLATEYIALLGLPTAAALAAKALVSNKTASQQLVKVPIDETSEKSGFVSGIAELISNDNGRVDIIDFQYVAFNLLTLGYFTIEFLTSPSQGLPEIPPTLLGLFGVAVAAYSGKKTLERSLAGEITMVIPRRVVPDEAAVLTINGSGFGYYPEPPRVSENDQPMVLLDGSRLVVDPADWSDRRIQARLGDWANGYRVGELPQAPELVVIDSDGIATPPVAIEIVG